VADVIEIKSNDVSKTTKTRHNLGLIYEVKISQAIF